MVTLENGVAHPQQTVEAQLASLEAAARALNAVTGELLREYKISQRQYQSLLMLSLRPEGVRVGELSVELMLQVNTVSEIVDGLVRRHWVSRNATQEDRRVSVLELTPAGKAFLATLSQAQIAHLQIRKSTLLGLVSSLGLAVDDILHG